MAHHHFTRDERVILTKLPILPGRKRVSFAFLKRLYRAGDEGFESRFATPRASQVNIVHLRHRLADCHRQSSPRS